ncbi:uncharacterized protein C20orf204 homolog [Dromiciops gliroides]|uniref:uncharacterized protein C20orf204 homolog n=1 Tax=Dromiciops gliroides TaxID=33562 RepID=UPI001CC8136C|nr:uncharacterized protein C20orf204 homolog [Dromiciops gliroides]
MPEWNGELIGQLGGAGPHLERWRVVVGESEVGEVISSPPGDWCWDYEPRDPAFTQVLAKPALCVLLLAILGSALGRGGRRRDCNVPDVLRHYRAVIFEELQTVKNLTGAGALRRRGRGRAGGASCRAEKEHRILMSISSMGRALRKTVAGTGAGPGRRRGALEKAVWTVAMHTEAVTREYCGTLHQRSQKRLSQEWQERKRGPEMEPELNLEPALAPGRSRGRGQRRRLLGAVEHLAACWEKLFSLRSLASATGSY